MSLALGFALPAFASGACGGPEAPAGVVVHGPVLQIPDGSSLCVLAAPQCDVELVSYEMSLLVEAAGEVLSPALRGAGPWPAPIRH